MATHKSAEKRARQAAVRRQRNRAVRSQVKSVVAAFRAAADGGDADAARQRLRDAERALRKAASKGVLPKRQASRRVARLARRLGSLASR